MYNTYDHTQMTEKDLTLFGLESTAYVRPMTVKGRRIHVIYAADGTMLTAVPDREVAMLTIRQNKMTPASVH